MSTHNIGFYEDLTKIIFELSSNTHLISSADYLETRKTKQRDNVLTILTFGLSDSIVIRF